MYYEQASPPSVVDFAVEVLRMDRKIKVLAAEVKELSEYKEKYLEYIKNELQHHQSLAGTVLTKLLDNHEGARALADS